MEIIWLIPGITFCDYLKLTDLKHLITRTQPPRKSFYKWHSKSFLTFKKKICTYERPSNCILKWKIVIL